MSNCAKSINWAGGTHVFDLNSPRVAWMLGKSPFPGQFGDTPAACLRRFGEEAWSTADVERIFEIGLIGGGLGRNEAASLVATHVRGQPIAANALIAYGVLANLFTGANHDDSSA